MSLTANIPADVLAAAPRSWTFSANGMGSRTIDRKWVEAWHRGDQAMMAERAASARKRAYLEDERRQHDDLQGIDQSVINLSEAAKVLRADALAKRTPGLSRKIVRAVAAHHRMEPSLIVSAARVSPIAAARQHAIYEIRRQCWWLSLLQIGRMFKRDHTTVLHATREWPKKAAKLGIECLPLGCERRDA